jgi:hypothetical protein
VRHNRGKYVTGVFCNFSAAFALCIFSIAEIRSSVVVSCFFTLSIGIVVVENKKNIEARNEDLSVLGIQFLIVYHL